MKQAGSCFLIFPGHIGKWAPEMMCLGSKFLAHSLSFFFRIPPAAAVEIQLHWDATIVCHGDTNRLLLTVPANHHESPILPCQTGPLLLDIWSCIVPVSSLVILVILKRTRLILFGFHHTFFSMFFSCFFSIAGFFNMFFMFTELNSFV